MARRARTAVKITPGGFRNVRGVEALQRKIAGLPEALLAELRPEVQKSGKRLLGAVKAIAPVSDLEARPGELRDNYRIEPGDHDLAVVLVGDARDDQGRPINKHVEHGHKAADGTKVEAVPHVFPAARLERKRFAAAVKRATNRGVKAAAQSGGSEE